MKLILISLAAISTLVFVVYIFKAVQSQKTPKTLGISSGQLRACPASPNCVCSETHTSLDVRHYITPIQGSIDAWKRLNEIIQQEGTIQEIDDTYIHAIFTTPVFRFVDDVELRFDAKNQQIHLRSASRVGHSDLGANRQRLERIKQALNIAMTGQ
ncbi:MAG: DUF1499 domain-containing protein [Mariprofundaceae bacterium]